MYNGCGDDIEDDNNDDNDNNENNDCDNDDNNVNDDNDDNENNNDNDDINNNHDISNEHDKNDDNEDWHLPNGNSILRVFSIINFICTNAHMRAKHNITCFYLNLSKLIQTFSQMRYQDFIWSIPLHLMHFVLISHVPVRSMSLSMNFKFKFELKNASND